jgi:uncharacterized integral membrane protein
MKILLFFRWIIGFTLAVAFMLFCVMNRETVSVFLLPFHDALSMPLYLLIGALAGSGFLIGGVTVWLNTASQRRLVKRQAAQIAALERDLTILQGQLEFQPHKHPSLPPSKHLQP